MSYQAAGMHNTFGSILGASGIGASQASQYNNASMANVYSYVFQQSETEEQRKARREREAKAEEERMEALRQQEERRALNRPKARKCFAGAIFLAASTIFFLSVNLHTEAHDYNTNLVVSLFWFLTVASAGFTAFLIVTGCGYLND
jgi:hypothetical protein